MIVAEETWGSEGSRYDRKIIIIKEIGKSRE